MRNTKRSSKELLKLINELQTLKYNNHKIVKEVSSKPNESCNDNETKKNNVIQKWLIESILNKERA